jgi:hypothetical protein
MTGDIGQDTLFRKIVARGIRGRRGSLEGNLEEKDTSLARSTLNPDDPVHQLHDLLGDD